MVWLHPHYSPPTVRLSNPATAPEPGPLHPGRKEGLAPSRRARKRLLAPFGRVRTGSWTAFQATGSAPRRPGSCPLPPSPGVRVHGLLSSTAPKRRLCFSRRGLAGPGYVTTRFLVPAGAGAAIQPGRAWGLEGPGMLRVPNCSLAQPAAGGGWQGGRPLRGAFCRPVWAPEQQQCLTGPGLGGPGLSAESKDSQANLLTDSGDMAHLCQSIAESIRSHGRRKPSRGSEAVRSSSWT